MRAATASGSARGSCRARCSRWPAAAASSAWPCPSATAAPASRTSASTVIVGEETQRAGVGSFGLGITLHNDICLPYFLTYCDEPQRERWLPGIASGELITALAMTEPGIGSDLAGMSTRARLEGDHYVRRRDEDVHHQRDQRRSRDRGRQDRPLRAPPRHQPARARARDGGLLQGAQPGEDRPARPGHRRAVVRRGARARREPAGRGGRGVSLPRLEPAPGAPVDRGLGRGGVRGGAVAGRSTTCASASAFGQPIGSLPELALHARRAAHRNRDRARVRRPLRGSARRRRR